MPVSNSVVRKMSVVVIAIVTLVVAAAGLVTSAISNHHALESARAVLRFNSESILSGIGNLMMTHNNKGVLRLIQDVSRDSTVYRDISLVSHHSGEVVVSGLGEAGTTLSENDRSCAVCHAQPELLYTSLASLDEVLPGPDGSRLLHVITPIANQHSCSTADCHAHVDSGPILGFLQTEYSLQDVDTLTSNLNTSFTIAALVSLVLGTTALWIMLNRMVTRPLRYMLSGIQAIAGNDLSFRFKTHRKDEFGLVEESFDDMARRIQAHQTELRDAREYLEAIVENSADIIITVNPKGLIQTVNRGAEQILGYQREELIARPIEMLFANPQERDVAIARLQDRDNVTNYETRFITKDRVIRNVLLTLSRLRHRDGTAMGTIGISKDVTTQKELEDLLVKSQTAAAIGHAVTAIQHAIKNMLNTLTGGTYLARNGLSKRNQARIEEGIEMIDEGIATISNLSFNMLKYAKEWVLDPEDNDLALIVDEICKAIRQTATDEGVSIRCEIADHLPLVPCDSRLLHMALMDIATNALHACCSKNYKDSETAAVVFRIYLDEDNGSIVVEVEDNGIGMDAETKANVFTPFFSTKLDSGTGLGLALTLRVVKLHNGSIVVKSEPERGALFRIILPTAAGTRPN